MSYNKALNCLMKIHLKYYILKLEKEYFTTQYAFDFIRYTEKQNITKEKCGKYYKEDKYNLDKSSDGKVKGEFIEIASEILYSNNDVLLGKIDNITNVKNIAEMEPLLQIK